MFKSWLICCRKGSSQLEGQNPGLGPPLPPRGHRDGPFSSQIYFKLQSDLRSFPPGKSSEGAGPQQAAPPPPHQSKVNFSCPRWPCSGLPDFRSTPASCCMHFTPVLFYSPALITPGSLQFWVVISYAEPRPPHGYAPPACLLPLESPSLAVWLPLSVEARGGASPPQRSSQRKSIWTCRSHHR